MFQDSILAFYQFLKNENKAKNAQRIFYFSRSILILLIFASSMITLSSGSPVTPDDKWKIVFDPGIDAPFNYSTGFAPKVWLHNQGGSLNSTASITYTYFDVNGNLQIATGTATNNGDGSYTGAALNMPDYADKYINVLFSVSAGSNTLREQHVFYAGQSNGAHGALWKIEVFNTSAGPSWNGNNQQKIYMKLYSDAGTLYRNNLITPTIAIWNSGGSSVLSATAMSYEEDGVYSYNISGYANGDYYFQIYNQWSSRQVTGGNTRYTKVYAGLYLEANNTQGDESLPQIDNVERKPYFPVDDDYVNITAHVLDNINITSANLYYTVNNQTVQTEPMIKQTDFEYRATLDPYLLEDNIRYRVEVNDGTNTASSMWYMYNVQDHRGSQNMSHSFLSHPVYWFGYSRQADLSVADRGGDTNYDGIYSTNEKDGVAYLAVTQSYPYFKDMTRIKVQTMIMDETGKPVQHLTNVTAWLSNNKTQPDGTHNREKTMTEVAGESGVYTAAWEGSPDVPNATYVWNEEAKAIWGQYISGEVYSVYIDINNDSQPEENITWLAYNVGDTFWDSSENGKNFNDHLNLEQGGSCSRGRCHNSMSGTSRVNLKPSCPDCHGVYRNANGGVWPVEKGSAVTEDSILYGNSTGHPRQDVKNATTCGDETCHNVAWGTSPSGTSSVEIPGYPAGTRLNATFRADYPNPMQCAEHHNFKAGKIPVQEGHNRMVACKYCHGGNHDNSKLIKYNISIMSTNLSNVNRGTPGYVGTGGVNGSGIYAGNCYKDCHRVQVDHSLTGMPGGASENKAVPCDECHQNFNNAPMHQENVFPYPDRESCSGCHQQQGNITPHNASITLSPPMIPATLLHSKKTGTNWNNTGTRPYWVENENSCRFCHGRSYNEAYGLGRIRNFNGTNIINDNITATSYWCASCHVDNGSETHYNYSAMAIIYNYSFGVVPPEITNSTWKSDRSGYQDHNALGFINKLDSGTYSDMQCFNCHAGNNSLDAGLDAWQHNLPGKPKHALSGYVTSISSGSPLSGAAVQAKSTVPNTTTDANGFYRFTALSDGTYIVNASLAGYISNSTIITVSGADVVNANISLSPVPPAPTYIPSAPSNLTSTQGNFWVNHTWQAGEGNVTDSYDVNVNGIWINGTAVTYYNSTVGAHNWSNITIWAYNSSGSGQLGLTPASNATQVANNNPVQAQIGTRIITAGNVLSFTVSAIDADSDPITYATNATKGTFNTTTGAYSWTTTVDDVGNYTWSFNSSDNYGGAAVETITVTVTSMLTYAVSGYVFDNNGAGLGGVLVQNGSFQDTTLASGYYSITGLINGTYSFSYSKTGFNTGYSDVAVSGADVINANKTIYDTTSPAQVTGLTGDIPTRTTVNLTWDSIADANFYQVFRDSNSIGYTMNTYWNDTGLIQNTSYQYWVRANDSYNNLGQNSSTLIITTASPEADCMGCHNSQRGVYPAIAALSFGKHKNVNTTNGTGVLDNNDCRTCHYNIANMTRPGYTTATKTCVECHIQGNFSARIIQNHMPPRLTLSPGANITTNAYCSTCHNNSINQFAYSVNASVGHYGTNASLLKPTINQTPLPVFGFMNSGDASAYNKECNNCHNPSNASWGDPTLITVPHIGRGTCNECHVNADASDLHNGSLSLPQTFGCLDCHTNYAARYRAPNITNTNMAGFGTCDSGCHGGGNVNGIMDANEHNTERNYAGTPGSTNTVYLNGQTTLTVPPGTPVTVTSRINDAGNAGRVGGAEYYIDIDPGIGKGVPMNPADGQFDAVGGAWEDITATIDTANLSAGTHTVYVRGMDIGKQWSTAQSATLTVGNNYIPPVPSDPVSTQGNFWINYTWEAGAGNVTNGYNVSVNGVWTNSTSTYSNNSVGAHGWSNISVYAYNNSGSGSLSPTPALQNTRVANNLPAQAPIGNKTVTAGDVLAFTVSAIDADSDQITYSSNKSKGTLDPTTGEYSWATTGSDAGTYIWYFSSSDSFGGVANETIIVTVNAVPTYIPQAPINLASTQGNFWINYTWEAGAGNVTNSYNVSVKGIWTNDTRTYSNNSVGAHGWSNITVWAYNSSGNGSLSLTFASQNTQVANNAPVQAPVGNKVVSEGDLLTFTVSAIDADPDAIIYRTSATKGTLDPATGVYSWTPGYTDAGNYVWEFNSSDNFSGVDTEVITVTVVNAPLTITSSTPVSDPTTTAGTALTFVTNLNRTATVTWYINGSAVQTNSSVATASYTNYTAGVGSYNITASATDGIDSVTRKWNWTVSAIPTYQVSGYVFDNYGVGSGDVLVQNVTHQTTTIASGYYLISGLLNGTYNFSYSKSGFNTGYLVITVSGAHVTNANKTILNIAAAASVTNPATTTGNFFINNTWVNPGDPDFNYTWFRYNNGTTLQNVSAPANYLNLTSLQHYIQNISAQTVDTYGNVNQTRVWFNVTIPNNAPVQAPVGNKVVSEGDLLTFTVSATDADPDTIIYRTNATKGTLDPATGVYSWTPGYTDAGNYVWEFNSSDNFSGVDTEVITVTVVNAPLTITSSTPVSDPATTAGTALTFVTNLNRTATATWYINGSAVQTNSSVATASYTNYTAGIGSYNVTASATDGIDSVTRKWNWTVSAIPTYQVSGYVFNNGGAGLGGVLVKNGSYQNTTTASGYYLITGVLDGTYNFSVSKTGFNTGYLMVTISGADNKTANKTIYDTTPPASVANLMNTSYAPTYINWTWNDPGDTDFEKVMIYLDGIFQINVSKGVRYYNATNLTSGTVYTMGTHTVDNLGNTNATTVNNTAATRQAITGVCIDCHPAVNVYLFGRHANVNTTDGGTTDADCKTCHRGAANGTMDMMPGAANHSNTYFCEDCHTSIGPGPIKPNNPALIKDELRHGSTNCQWCHIAGDQLPRPLDSALKYHAIGPKGTATGNTCKSCHVDANLPDSPFHAPGETHATSASCIGGCHDSNNHFVTYIDQPRTPPVLENIIITSPVSTGNFAQVQTTLRDTQTFLQIAAAQYQVKDASGNAVIDWTNMTPQDGRLNSYTEIVNASINTSNLLGTYTVYIKGMSSAPKTDISLPYYPFNGLWSGAASRTLNVTQPTGYVNGTVRNGSGSNLSGATVTTNTGVSKITDANGFYSLSLVSGTYQLTISKEPEYYSNNSVTVTAISSTTITKNIILAIKSTGNIVGVVRNT